MLAPLYFEPDNSSQQFQEEIPRSDNISLNLRQKGTNIKVQELLQNNYRYFNVTGSGRVFADTQLLQDKSYFEIHINSNFGKNSFLEIGLIKEITQSNYNLALNIEQEDENAFVTIFGNKIDQIHASEGTIIGIAFDQSDVHPQMIIFKDGIMIETKVGMRGKLTPCLGLFPEGDEVLKANIVFEQKLFHQNMPSGFSAILKSVDIF